MERFLPRLGGVVQMKTETGARIAKPRTKTGGRDHVLSEDTELNCALYCSIQNNQSRRQHSRG
jgi:hypothetical protein